MFSCYVLLSPVPLPLVLFEPFVGQEQYFIFLQHQAQQLPNLSEEDCEMPPAMLVINNTN